MTDIDASETVPAPREAVFAFLSDLRNHWAVAGRWIEVVALDGEGDGGRVRIRGPLGVRRTAVTSVERVDPPERLEGTARLGRTEARVAWTLHEQRDGATEVRLVATVVRAGPLDRAVLALGGASWMRRLFAATLARLAARFAAGARSARA
ncbi:MAG TPA: SRPBCC family protein [Solirubrobacteraceae bacterium]|nr:SRPBCC family protein [Solirubrobacteraceae bacterium]